MIGNSSDRYGSVAQGLHWLVAALMLGLFAVGLWMGDLPKGDFKASVYGVHKALGVLILVLVTARLAWTAVNPRPTLADMPAWQRTATTLAHVALYLLMFAIPMTGWLMSDSAGRPTSFFGLFTLPTLIAKNEPLHDTLEEGHEILAFVMIGLVSLHVAAALWHHHVRRDTVLTRMLPVR